MSRAVIIATGSYLPEKILTNDDLSRMVETSDEWIRERTGIRARHIVAEGEATSHLAIRAAQATLTNGGLTAADIDGIIVATATPDSTMPSVAARVQAGLGISRGGAVDVAAACTGFIYALSVANGWLATGIASRVLVIGAETMSRIVDWKDRNTCVLFGDGAGAVVLEAQANESKRGIVAMSLEARGEFAPLLGTTGGVSSTQTAGYMFMQGQEVFRHGVDKMAEITLSTLAKAGLSIADIDWLIPHQANARMIRMIGKKLGVPEEKCVITVESQANTSAATIPLALDAAQKGGKLKKGDLVALPALGAGLTWGCCVIYW